jgi:hypothetical protein
MNQSINRLIHQSMNQCPQSGTIHQVVWSDAVGASLVRRDDNLGGGRWRSLVLEDRTKHTHPALVLHLLHLLLQAFSGFILHTFCHTIIKLLYFPPCCCVHSNSLFQVWDKFRAKVTSTFLRIKPQSFSFHFSVDQESITQHSLCLQTN